MTYGISWKQIKFIKTMSRQVFGGDDAAYREMLWGVARVKSCKELKGAKIDVVIRHLEKCLGKQAPEPGDRRLHSRAPNPPRPPLSKGGVSRATARQVYEIRELWAIVSRAADKEKALRSFLLNRFKVSAMEWLTLPQASKVIEGLKQMVRRANTAEEAQ